MLTRAAALTVLFAASCVATFAAAEELVTPVSVEVTLHSAQGHAIANAIVGKPVRLRASFRNVLLDRPHRLNAPRGFLRPLEDGDGAQCGEMARALRTTGAFARGDITLDGYYLGLIGAARRLTVVDPAMSLASSNILRLIDLPENPKRIVADGRGGWLAGFPSGLVARIDPVTGKIETLADNAGVVRNLVVADAGIAVLDESGRIRIIGPSGVRDVALEFTVDSISVASAADRLVVARGVTGAALIDLATGRIAYAIGEPTAAAAYSALAYALVAVAPGASVLTVYRRDGGAPDTIPIAHSADIIALAGDGRLVVAVNRASGQASLADVAFGQLVQAIAFDGPIQAMAVTQGSVFFLIDGGSTLAILPRAAIEPGKAPALRRIPIGARPAPGETSRAALVLTPDGQGVLALPPDGRTVLRAQDAGLHASTSLAAVPLRGDEALELVIASRQFRSDADGVYEAPVAFARPGRHRLVIFDYGPTPVACQDLVALPDPDAAPAQSQIIERSLSVLRATRVAEGLEIFVRIDAASGKRPHMLLAQSLTAPTRTQSALQLLDDGSYKAVLKMPSGPFAIHALFTDGRRSAPVMHEAPP